MTGPHGWDIPPEQVAMLRQIQQLSVESRRLLTRLYGSGDPARADRQTVARLNDVERQRELTEITARAAGVAPEWIDHVRNLGRRGVPWSSTQPLPAPTTRPVNEAVERAGADMEKLKDMAAVDAAYLRQYWLVAGRLPDRVVAEGLLRNMEALWMRAGRTAHARGLPAQQRTDLWTTSAAEWQHRVRGYLVGPSVAELEIRWHTYASPTIARDARRTLKRLQYDGLHGPGVPLPDPMPPRPHELLGQARDALTAVSDRTAPPDTGADTAAIEALLDNSPHPAWPGVPAEQAPDSAPEHRRDHDIGPGPDRRDASNCSAAQPFSDHGGVDNDSTTAGPGPGPGLAGPIAGPHHAAGP
ncbi:hypothetical protein [Nocardia wallacei]|uniref:hypothetical protein n=1 Tax=Nocardia wallacei TaxID=480035 RepID=UPI002454FC4D|nr:hypothetical protein [Nocardia wallacei]